MISKKPRVCFVALDTYPVLACDRRIDQVGGTQVQQSLISKGLAAEGYEVSMVSMDYGQAQTLEIGGVTLHRTYAPDAGIPGLRAIHPRLSMLWRAMARADADIYYQMGCSRLTAWVAAFCALHRRRFVFAAAHDLDFDPSVPLIQFAHDKWLFRNALPHAHAVVVQNALQYEAARSVWKLNPLLIDSCGAEPGNANPRHDGYVLWAATIRRWKRPELFLELARRLPDKRFRMVGGAASGKDGLHYFEEIRTQAALLPNLEFIGFVPFADIDAQFDGASLFVNTSESEGFPNTFLQAWSRRMPTVSFFDTGARHEGRAVEIVVSDAVQMAGKVKSLLDDEQAWSGTGRNCRAYFEAHHSVAQTVGSYASLFAELMLGKSQA